MLAKICTTCGVEKPLADFSRSRINKDGLQYKCKVCTAIYDRSPQAKESRRRYSQTSQGRETSRRGCKKYAQTLQGGEARQRARRKYYQSNPEKITARSAVCNAIQSGKLVRSVFCEFCGLPAETEGHHEDYNKPLDVDWLCIKCHTKK